MSLRKVHCWIISYPNTIWTKFHSKSTHFKICPFVLSFKTICQQYYSSMATKIWDVSTWLSHIQPESVLIFYINYMWNICNVYSWELQIYIILFHILVIWYINSRYLVAIWQNLTEFYLIESFSLANCWYISLTGEYVNSFQKQCKFSWV